MTAQAPDEFYYLDQRFSIANFSGTKLFVLENYGITPVSLSTGHYRGYVSTYTTIKNSLYLTSLHLGLKRKDEKNVEEGIGPKLCGKIPKQYIQEVTTQQGEKLLRPYGYIYEDLHIPIFFTGGILIGTDFIWGMYVHSGLQPAYKYRKVCELIFNNGLLQKQRDCSKEMEEFRELIFNHSPSKKEIKKQMEQCFSLDYEWY